MPPHHHHHHHAHWFKTPRSIEEKLDLIESLLPKNRGSKQLSFNAFEGGPHHKRASNSILGAILAQLLEEAARKQGVEPRGYQGESIDVDWNVPPHLRHRRTGSSRSSAPLPMRLISRLCASRGECDEVVDALTDGPEHDVAANVVLLNLLESLYDVVSGGDPSAPILWKEEEPAQMAKVSVRTPAPHEEEPRKIQKTRNEPSELATQPEHPEETPETEDPNHSRSIFDWGFRFKLWKIKNGKPPKTP